jgi:UPF0755 protein
MIRLIKLGMWIVVLWFLVSWALYHHRLNPIDEDSTKKIPVTIESGTSVRSIGTLLEEKEVIRSGSAFTKYVSKHDLDTSLRAGTFVLSPSQSVEDIAQLLSAGQTDEDKITIPEGFTVAQIDALLAERGFGEAGDLIHCAFTCDFSSFSFLPKQNASSEKSGFGSKLEGYLFPDTYFVSRSDYVPKFFLERMLGAYRTNVVNGLSKDLTSSNRTLAEITIMASLIEEETRMDDERPVVSGILWKRFDAKTGLGVDATLRYLHQNQSDPLTASDLDADSPYNTRKYRGLPPGPISNAGLKSLQAALHPEPSDYWYYLHDPSGQIHYAKTNDEHNENKATYLR